MATARRTARSAPAAPRSSGYRGAEGMRRMQEEHERAEQAREANKLAGGMPFRFYCPVGETREVVVVDDKPDFFRYEHNLKNSRSGKYDIFTSCINDHANCPVCKNTDRSPYFAMYLTVIDLTPYETRDGDEVDWSKKLLVVKSAQQKKFTRLFEKQGKMESMRGMILTMYRDGEKDAAIGNDIEFAEFMDEDELLEYETTYKDQNGKVHDVIGHEPYDYDALFPEQSEQQLRAIVGGKAETGSRESDDRELGRRRRGARDTDEEERPARSARRTRTAEPEEEEVEEEEAAEEPVRRGRGRPRKEEAAAPARSGTARRVARAPDPEEAEEEEEVEEEVTRPARGRPATRNGATRAAAPAADGRRGPRTAPARRVREPEAEEEADDAPPPRSSMAERRRALRSRGA